MSRDRAPDIPDEQVEALVSASRALVGVAVLSLSELGDKLSLVQFRALVVLNEAGTLKAHDLADRLGVSASSVTRLCDRLVADGLMRRIANPLSRREVLLTLSRQGTQLVRRVLERRRRDLRRILSTLSGSERASVVAALEKFATHASDVHGQHVLDEWPVS